MSSIVTRELRLLSARQFVEAADSAGYYAWVGNPVDPSASREIYDAPFWTSIDPYAKMVFGSEVTESDVSLMVREVPYTANVVYAKYNDEDPLLYAKDFFVTVESGSFTHVFKCLNNNNGEPSTAAPNIGDVVLEDIVYQTSDGYQWKYLYTVDDAAILKFSSPGFIPLSSNSAVEAAAVVGAIEVIEVVSPGLGYSNHLTGTFSASEIAVSGNSRIYSLESNTSVSTSNGFYTGCVLYLSSGVGAGQYSTVSSFVSNSSGRYAVLSSSFAVPPTNGTGWEVTPEVIVTGYGHETVTARARAVVNSVGNTISSVEILDRGLNYSGASARVVANSIVGVANTASVRPIAPPPGGHGSDAASELGCTRVSVSVRLDGTLGNTVPSGGRFGQFGLITKPVFSTANLGFSAYGGTPEVGASYSVLDTVRVEGGVSVTTGANTVSKADAAFDQVFTIGDRVLLKEDATDRFLGTVTGVNSSVITVHTNIGWTGGNVTVYTASLSATAEISSVNAANSVVVRSITGDITTGTEVIVSGGGHWATVDSVTRSGKAKSQSTFTQAWKAVGAYVSGTMQEDEVVFQGTSVSNSTFTAWAHSVADDGGTITVFMVDAVGRIDLDRDLKGNTSLSTLNISEVFEPELVPGSGRVFYVEDIAPVSRSGSQAEELNFLLTFGV